MASGAKCIARPDKDFEFSSWVENQNRNSTIPLNQSTITEVELLNSKRLSWTKKRKDGRSKLLVERK